MLLLFSIVVSSIITSGFNALFNPLESISKIFNAVLFGWIFPISCYIFIEEKYKNFLQYIFCLIVLLFCLLVIIKSGFTKNYIELIKFLISSFFLILSYRFNNSLKLHLLRMPCKLNSNARAANLAPKE